MLVHVSPFEGRANVEQTIDSQTGKSTIVPSVLAWTQRVWHPG